MKLDVKFKKGDIVVTRDNDIGYIDSICECKNCKEREFFEPHVNYIKDGEIIYDDYITNCEYEIGLPYYSRIGEYDLDWMRECNFEVKGEPIKNIYGLNIRTEELDSIKKVWEELSDEVSKVADNKESEVKKMPNKITVVEKKINPSVLRWEIDKFEETSYGNEPPYLIMSDETCEALWKHYAGSGLLTKPSESTYGTYEDCPIAICNKLEFGEVEIR